MNLTNLFQWVQAHPSETIPVVISLLALAVAVLTFIINYRLARRTAILARKPVLVFEYDDAKGWVMRNVGMGPALNTTVAFAKRKNNWEDPVRVPPLSKDGSLPLPWLATNEPDAIGVTYSDFDGRPYTSTCQDDLSEVFDGLRLKRWDKAQITRYWERVNPFEPPKDNLSLITPS